MTADPRIVLTGPGGWIGTAFLALLAERHGPEWRSRVTLFGSSERMLACPDGADVPVRALPSIASRDVDGALVIHLAYLTKEKVDQLGARAFFDANNAIDDAVLNALSGAGPHALFVASSGAAALAESGRDRHLYGVCKLLQEDRYRRFADQAKVPVLNGRIFNIAGPYINKLDAYAISSFLMQGLRTGRIEVQARTPVFRSYLHVLDLCGLVLDSLGHGWAPERPIDLCGPEIVEMSDIADIAARALGLDGGAVHRGAVDHDRPSIYLGDPVDTKTLAMRFGARPRTLFEQVRDTLTYLRGKGNSAKVR